MAMRTHFLLSIVCLLACNGYNGQEFKNKNQDSVHKDTLILYHSDSSAKGSRSKFVQNLGELMKLPIIEKGVKGFCTRIWTYNTTMGRFVINIIVNDSTKQIELIKWASKKVNNREYILIQERYNVIPKSGWEVFIDTLSIYGITNLKGGTPYNKQNTLLTEMDPVQFEIAKNKSYSFVEYLEPSFYKENESDSVYKFLTFLNKELDKKIYTP